jgi:AcrR family transcriptional regulator
MPRTVNEEAYNAKRNKILDFAQALIYSKGYERMTIQDILNGLQISRGALYHYFDSKKGILVALVDRMGSVAEHALRPIIEDPNLSALEKFNRYFAAGASWKNTQKDLIVSLLSMWFSDENAFIRQKMTVEALTRTARLLVPMIRQGVEEKVFTTQFPEEAAVIITGVFLNLTDTLIARLLARERGLASIQELGPILDAYRDAVERILGAASGSLNIVKADDFEDWFAAGQSATGMLGLRPPSRGGRAGTMTRQGL